MAPTAESEGMDVTREEEEAEQEEMEETAASRGGGGGSSKRGAKPKGRKRGQEEAGVEEETQPPPGKKRQSDASNGSSEAGGGEEGSARGEDEEGGDEEDEDGDDEEEDMNERYLEPRHAINMPGRTAELGVIVKIYCENFMCHRKLSVTLCPNVNFINGQNGSGKSAILAALQICLGARANITHRGRKLSDLIRQGHNGAAIVRVSLSNKGMEAFQPQRFGDFITVERKIERSGASSYALLKGNPHSDSPKYITVSRDKKDLISMLDAFNIQIDNPCALLDQENAKRFIQGDATEKYKFFEKATDIERVKRALELIQERLLRTEQQMAAQQQQVKKVQETHEQLKELREKMEALERIDEDIRRARVELSWAMHRNNVDGTNSVAREVATLEKQVEKLRASVAAAEAEAKEKTAASEGAEEGQGALKEQANDAKRTIRELKQQAKALKAQVRDKEEDIKAKTEEIKRAIKNKKEAQKKMDEEREKLASNAQEKIGGKIERVRAIEAELEAAEAEQKEVVAAYDEARAAGQALKDEFEEVQREAQRVQAQLGRLEKEKREASAAQGKLAGYGPQLESLVREVEKNAKRFRKPPLGPLGVHIKIRDDAQEWAGPVENAIGSGITNFVVTCHEDRQVLQELMRKTGCHWVYILTMRPDMAKHRVREPSARGVKSVAQCVAVEEPLVWNALVDWAKIDTSAVFRTEQEARSFITQNGRERRFPFPIKSGYHLDDRQTDVTRGMITTRPVTGPGSSRRKLGVDRSQILAGIEREIAAHKAEGKAKQQRQAAIKAENGQLQQRLRQLQAQDEKLQRQIASLREEKEELDEEIREAQALADGASATQAGGVLDDLAYQVQAAEEDIRAAQEAQAALKAEVEKIKAELEPLEQREQNEGKRVEAIVKKLEHHESRMASLLEEIEEAKRNLKSYEKGLKKAEGELVKQRQALEAARAADEEAVVRVREYTREVLGAEWDGQDIAPKEKQDELKKKVIKMQKMKDEEAARHATSDSVAVIREKEKRALQAFNRIGRDVLKLEETTKALKEAREHRRRRLAALSKFMTRQADRTFDLVLQHRGQSGRLEFDKKEKTLDLHVQKDNNDDTTRSADVRELSGGERSFSTLALLLALGEAIECPFRAMDEFDIFMDAVARKVALSKLIETARSEQMRHRQFIFITPQDLSAVQKYVGDDFKIHKMRPPERADRGLQQTTLN